jgi:glutathione S-transferase
MFKLHIANKNYSSWSLRPWVLMRELDLPFEEQLTPFGGGGPEGFRAFSPSGKVPCLIDGDTVVWDSLAITEYLAEIAPRVWPADPRARAWARSAAAEMHSGFQNLRGTCGMNCGLRVEIAPLPAGVVQDLARIDALWNEGLQRFGGPFLAGATFTGVDAFFAPVAFRVQSYLLSSAPARPPEGSASQSPEWAQPANHTHPLPQEGGWGDGSSSPARPPEGGASQSPERAQPANHTPPLPPEGGWGKATPMSAPALAYVQRLLALPAMQAWYASALAEPWRDAEHEEETRRVGTVTQDLRAPPAPGR